MGGFDGGHSYDMRAFDMFVCWLRYDRSEYNWGENLAVGVYRTDDPAVIDFFGGEVYIEISAKNSRDCDGNELLNYLPQSRVFRLYSANGELLNTCVTEEYLYESGKFEVAMYRADGQILSFRIGFAYRTKGGIVGDTLLLYSGNSTDISARFTRSNGND